MVQTELKSRPLYLYLVAIWLLAVVLFAYVIIDFSIDTAKRSFHDKVDNLYHTVEQQLDTNETIIDGFAATVDAMGKLDRVKIRDYVRRIRKRYPNIFMFEIAEKIPRQEKDSFEKLMRETVYDKFSIRRFTYDSDRKWYPSASKAFYLPIIFMQPFPPASRQVLGLDLLSNKMFVDSLQESARLHVPVATMPFELVEGHRAYVIHRPINEGVTTDKDGYAKRYVMLVLLGKSLFNGQLSSLKGYGITLYHEGFDGDGKEQIIYSQNLPASSQLQKLLFPKFSEKSSLNSQTQPFTLRVEEQMGWGLINWRMLLLLLFIALITYYVVIRYAQAYHKSRMQRAEETNRLFYMANHDTLTGLANRNLMMDRLSHAIKQAIRTKTNLAVLFLDIDDFKNINDKFGHEAGDQILVAVAERLRTCIRTGDTLARRSGDEFVIILENVASRDIAEQVVSKINETFKNNIQFDDQTIEVQISIGLAMYPEDGEEAKALLEFADKKMYEKK